MKQTVNVRTSMTMPLLLQTTPGFSSDNEHSRTSSLFCLAVTVSGSLLVNRYSIFFATYSISHTHNGFIGHFPGLPMLINGHIKTAQQWVIGTLLDLAQ